MAVTISTNLSAMRAVRQLDRATSTLGVAQERLSSGLRINHASDDAAGLAVATSLNMDQRILNKGISNINDGISLLNIADGATSSLSDVLTRLKELSIQASNWPLSNQQRSALDREAQALVQEHDRIIKTTTFNELALLDESNASLMIQMGTSTLDVGIRALQTVGSGNFTTGAVYSENTANVLSLVSGDFNGDGIVDLAGRTVNVSDGFVNIMTGNGNGTFKTPVRIYAGTNAGAAAETEMISAIHINNDGKTDIVVSDASSGFYTLRSNGDGTFKASSRVTPNDGPFTATAPNFR